MLLDMSRSPTHDDIKKKNLDEVLAVPEYTEAIYTHLRETEVSKRTFNMCISVLFLEIVQFIKLLS